ncbi:MAG: transposase [Thermodesulfobacteriota bacterium]|nr:transposase [Thermodesulfobacteriota bacterium]
MKYNPEIHHRRSIRLKGRDYSAPGYYFITIVTHDRICSLGEIVDDRVLLNDQRKIVENEWLKTPHIRPNTALDEYVIMPNHIHGIIVIKEDGHGNELQNGDTKQCRGTLLRAPASQLNRTTQSPPKHEKFGKPTCNSIPTIVRSFKATVTRQINAILDMQGTPVWQRNYYEHVIRDEEELNGIREYILYNPMTWERDVENPVCHKKG